MPLTPTDECLMIIKGKGFRIDAKGWKERENTRGSSHVRLSDSRRAHLTALRTEGRVDLQTVLRSMLDGDGFWYFIRAQSPEDAPEQDKSSGIITTPTMRDHRRLPLLYASLSLS
ncbi:hypothetical protein KQX54_021385 [Cotesia glomerata]|uniref:NERD domain-containing protein n=1 Tax=Cotesia glomerata TaxID=32391 RepID=A0AAV7J770_COTGL|nr:hypothetical protein KQX54_021385 [Cotesia glomerata]